MVTKLEVILEELNNTEDDFIYTDCDVVFLHNPQQIFESADKIVKDDFDVNVFFASDSLEYSDSGNQICAGFMNVKNIKGTKEFFERVYDTLKLIVKDGNPESHDQGIIRSFISNGTMKEFVYAVYPLTFISNGHFYFSEKVRTGSECIVHCNFRIGNDKINSMKEAGFWYIEEEV
jgi:hypothetical protein